VGGGIHCAPALFALVSDSGSGEKMRIANGIDALSRFHYTGAHPADGSPSPLTARGSAHYKQISMRIPAIIRRDHAPQRYSPAAVALHWLTALFIVGGATLGLSMVDLPLSRQKFQWYAWHKWIGITIFLLTCARLAWRLRRPAPAQLQSMPVWQRQAAWGTHAALYALLLVIPLSGWLFSSATGVQVVYLGLLPLPNLIPKDKALADVLRATHLTLNFTLLVLVCVHSAAALWHHFVDRDAVLKRMLPRFRTLRPKDFP
jgi:cytochrome b561